MEIKNNLLYDDAGKQVSYKPTPNQGPAFKPGNLKYLILHYTADTDPGQSIGWFLNSEAKASAHLLIDRAGNITQFAPFSEICWHCGQSQWKNIIGLNSHAIGIELTNAGKLTKKDNGFICGTDQRAVPGDQVVYLKHKNEGFFSNWQTYTPKQLEVAAKVAEALNKAYHFSDILGHDDIAPGRKQDPGPAFNMDAFKTAANFATVEYLNTTQNVNLRTGPGTAYTVLSVITKGAQVKVTAHEGDWSKVVEVATNKTGYVNSNFIL